MSTCLMETNKAAHADGKSAAPNGRRRYVLLLDDDEVMSGDVAVPTKASQAAPKLANPGPLGLLGFGLTTILLNLHNAGLHNLTTAIVGMGAAFGGIAQFVAGILEYFRGNTFAFVAFSSYGSFWISLVCLWMLDTNKVNPFLPVSSTGSTSQGCYMLVWGLFTFFMFFSALRTNLGITVVFGTLALLFFLLAISSFTGSPVVNKIAGYEGIFCGASAFYVAIAEVTNEVYGRELLPLVPLEGFWRKRKEDGGERPRQDIV